MIWMKKMLSCEQCKEEFDEEEHQPLILSDCGHTFCQVCVLELLVQSEVECVCPICATTIQGRNLGDFTLNQKIIDALEEQFDAKPLDIQETKDTELMNCPRHANKQIEYFCKDCTMAVCVKCMYGEHNGHSFLQIDDICNTLKQHTLDLMKIINTTTQINTENITLLKQTKDDLLNLQKMQMTKIDKGFEEILIRLQEKKEDLKLQFQKRYKREERKFDVVDRRLNQASRELVDIRELLENLSEFVADENHTKVIKKIDEFITFLNKSYEDLERIKRSQILDRKSLFIPSSYKPLVINVRKALELISKFEMLTSKELDREGLPPLRFPQLQSPGVSRNSTQLQRSSSRGEESNSARRNSALNKSQNEDEGRNLPKKSIIRNSQKGEGSIAVKSNLLGSSTKIDQELVLGKKAKIPDSLRSLTGQKGSTTIFLFGDSPYVLKLNIDKMLWSKTRISKGCSFKGNLKYMSCLLYLENVYLIGGCISNTNEASNQFTEIKLPLMFNSRSKCSLIHARYGHSSCMEGDTIYTMGGFNHPDVESEPPSTLVYCEKYNFVENKWKSAARMREARAFGGCVRIDRKIYIIGGLKDYSLLDSIEQYSTVVDIWTIINYKMAEPLAKFGVHHQVEQPDTILLFGGLTKDFECVNIVRKVVVREDESGRVDIKLTKEGHMKQERVLNGHLPHVLDYLYVIGGNDTCSTEYYSISKNKWSLGPSYTSCFERNELYTFSSCVYAHTIL